MTTEEQREKERKRWHRRYADPEFRKKAIERSKKRVAKWLEKEENREHVRLYRREYYRKNREKFREYNRKRRERIKAQGKEQE